MFKTKARKLADMISDGLIGTTEITEDALGPVALSDTGNYNVGQLLVNTTDEMPWNNQSDTGIALRTDGIISNAAYNTTALRVNRLGGTGPIIEMQSGGWTEGVVGVKSGRFFYGGSGSGIALTSSAVLPSSGSGTIQNGSKDLGQIGASWRDLHISGNLTDGSNSVTVAALAAGGGGGSSSGGGGGADFEDGTFTPQFNGADEMMGGLAYHKIGKLVHIQGVMWFANVYASELSITNLPFMTSSNYWGGGATPIAIYKNGNTGEVWADNSFSYGTTEVKIGDPFQYNFYSYTPVYISYQYLTV